MMSNRVRRLVLVAFAFTALAAFGVSRMRTESARSADAARALTIRPATPLPAFSVHSPDGGTSELPTTLQGSGGVLLVVHPACEHCHDELATLSESARRDTAAGATKLVVVSVGDAAQTSTLRSEFPALDIVQDVDSAFLKRFHLTLVPTTIVVDGSGTVSQVHGGVMNEETRRTVLGTR